MQAPMLRADQLKILLSCFSGGILEWFDFAVYGYLTPILASLFFPSSSKLASILLTYGVFAIGFLFRPLGAILFGYIGDRLGRKTALVSSSLLMALPTFLIGLLPTYSSIGILAPLLLICCRILQGISIGGEFTGSFVYLVEQSSPGRKGFFSCFADMGCCSGMILGSLCVALLNTYMSAEQLSSFGWRLPFLSGIALSLVALYIRSSLSESPEFTVTEKPQKTPLKQVYLEYPGEFIYSTLLISINALGFYMLVVFIPNQAVLSGKILPAYSYLMNTFIMIVLMIATFFAACACDYWPKEKLYLGGIIGALVLSFPVFYAIHHFDLLGQVFMTSLLAIAIGFCFGPRPLFLTSIFPPAVRYSAIALAANLSNGLLGGFAPLAATYLVAKTASIEYAAVLVIFAASLSLYAMLNLLKLKAKPKYSRVWVNA